MKTILLFALGLSGCDAYVISNCEHARAVCRSDCANKDKTKWPCKMACATAANETCNDALGKE